MNILLNIWNEIIYGSDNLLWGCNPSNVAELVLKVLTKNKIKSNNTLTLLDVGCGYGRDAKFFCESGFNVVGIDYSKNAILKAQKNNPNSSYMLCNILNGLPFDNKAFFVCYCNAVLQWFNIAQIQFIIGEMLRVTKIGGFVVIAIPMFFDTEKRNKELIFSNNGIKLFKYDILKQFSSFKFKNEIYIKEYHTHGGYHEHDYYLLLVKTIN